MPKFNKPDSPNLIWGVNALDADLTKPDDSYIQTGWTQVKPPYEYENYSINKLYQGLAYYNQLGIPEWDSATEYQAGKSYVQASNNRVYKCIQTHSNRNPSVGGNTDYWEIFSGSLPKSVLEETGKLELPVSVAGIQQTLIVQWDSFSIGDNQDQTVRSYPEPFPNQALFINGSISTNNIPSGTEASLFDWQVSLVNKSSFNYSYNRRDAIGRNEKLFILAIGY